MNETPLNCWLICKPEGKIVIAHCDCVAGLGETCTHVSSVFFAIDRRKRSETEVSPADIAAYWTAPSKVGQPDALTNITFDTKKQHAPACKIIYKRTHTDSVPALSKGEVCEIIKKLKVNTEKGCGLEAVVQPFAKELKKDLLAASPSKLTLLYKSEYENSSLETLKEIGNKLN